MQNLHGFLGVTLNNANISWSGKLIMTKPRMNKALNHKEYNV